MMAPANPSTQPSATGRRRGRARGDVTTEIVHRALAEAQLAVDQLIAVAMAEHEFAAEMLLAPAALLASSIADDLADALYRNEKLDQSHRSNDLAVARALAGIEDKRLAA